MDWEPHDRHWIRLQGPWEVAWIDDDGAAGPKESIRLPADWRTLFGDRSGTARFSRVFQRPTRIDPEERVCITLTNVGAEVHCRINETATPALPTPLGDTTCWPSEDCCSFDVTRHLQTTNRLSLAITVHAPVTSTVGLHEPVLIEIVTLDEQIPPRNV